MIRTATRRMIRRPVYKLTRLVAVQECLGLNGGDEGCGPTFGPPYSLSFQRWDKRLTATRSGGWKEGRCSAGCKRSYHLGNVYCEAR